MMNNDSTSQSQQHDDTQFVLSYELVCLLRWLIEHNSHQLKTIVKKALNSGLQKEIKGIESPQNNNSLEDIQHSIVDFFGLLESLLVETLHEQAVQKTIEKNLMPSIDHIDAQVCDDTVIQTSIEKVASKLDNSTQEAAQELLFKEILRRWKPDKKKKVLN